jgi:hypothetical protein
MNKNTGRIATRIATRAATRATAKKAGSAAKCARRAKSVMTLLLALALVAGSMFAGPADKAHAANIGLKQLLRGYNLFSGEDLPTARTLSPIYKAAAETALADYYEYQEAPRGESFARATNSMEEIFESKNVNIGASVKADVNAVVTKVSVSAKYSRNDKNSFKNSIDTWFFESGLNWVVGTNKFKNWDTQATQAAVKAQLDQDFLNALLNTPIASVKTNLFAKYGTHVVTGYSLGGWSEMTSSSTQTKDAGDSYSKDDFSASVSAGTKVLGVGATVDASFNYSREVESKLKSEFFTTESKSNVYGGAGGITLSNKVDNVEKIYNDWVKSLKVSGVDANCVLVPDDRLALVGIWELLPDGNEGRKSQLRQEFEEMLYNFDLSFCNEFVYKSMRSGGRSIPVERFASGAPTGATKTPIGSGRDFVNIGFAGFPLNGNYELTADIDLSGYTKASDYGMMGKTFTGTFEGNGFTIKNFKVSLVATGATSPFGLFGTNNGTIKNLFIKDSKMELVRPLGTNTIYAGFVAATNNGTIENVRVENSAISEFSMDSGSSSNFRSEVGGIAGDNKKTISKCSFTKGSGAALVSVTHQIATVTTATTYYVNAVGSMNIFAGGIAGYVSGTGGAITDCYTDASVSATGLCQPTGNLLAEKKVGLSLNGGGIAGITSTGSKIERCFAVGSPTVRANLNAASGGESHGTSNSFSGQLVGKNGATGTLFTSSYYTGTAVGSGGSTGATKVSSYKDAAIVDALKAKGWVYQSSYSYPRLPDLERAGQKFSVYYKGSLPSYKQGDVLPSDLSKHMNVYFAGNKNITNEVQVRYDFKDAGNNKTMQLLYTDAAGTAYIGEISVNVAATPFVKEEFSTSGDSGAPAATAAPAATPAPEPGATPPPAPPSAPPAGDIEYDAATAGVKNGIKLMATITEVGIKFDWAPGGNRLGYRIYRSTQQGVEGISISDFPITGSQFVDVNVKTNTQYFYNIRAVTAEAELNRQTFELTDEKVGAAGEELPIKTGVIVTRDAARQFILMKIGKDTMQVNESTTEIDQGRGTKPLILDSRTMVPIRAIIETMSGTVDWDDSAQQISLAAYGHTVVMKLNGDTIVADGVRKDIDVPPTTINDRTMVPVRFVAENVGCNIQWIGSTEEIIIVFYTQAGAAAPAPAHDGGSTTPTAQPKEIPGKPGDALAPPKEDALVQPGIPTDKPATAT